MTTSRRMWHSVDQATSAVQAAALAARKLLRLQGPLPRLHPGALRAGEPFRAESGRGRRARATHYVAWRSSEISGWRGPQPGAPGAGVYGGPAGRPGWPWAAAPGG